MSNIRYYKKYVDEGIPSKNRLFHYTSKESAQKIIASGKIKVSAPWLPKRGISLPSGVYFNDLSPKRNSTDTILWNNYDGAGLANKAKDSVKTQVALAFYYDDLDEEYGLKENDKGNGQYEYVTSQDVSMDYCIAIYLCD